MVDIVTKYVVWGGGRTQLHREFHVLCKGDDESYWRIAISSLLMVEVRRYGDRNDRGRKMEKESLARGLWHLPRYLRLSGLLDDRIAVCLLWSYRSCVCPLDCEFHSSIMHNDGRRTVHREMQQSSPSHRCKKWAVVPAAKQSAVCPPSTAISCLQHQEKLLLFLSRNQSGIQSQHFYP